MALDLLKSHTGRTLIESHRGCLGRAPENSWSAITLGRELGADIIEIDVQTSRDGVPFLRHPYRLPDGRWCRDLAWETLKAVQIDGEPLPRLDDVLDWAREAGVYLSLDIKASFNPALHLTETVVNTVRKTRAEDIVSLLFLDHDELYQTKRAYPCLAVRALLRGRLFDYAGYLRSIGADCANVCYDICRPGDIEAIHAAGIAVAFNSVWNPNADSFRRMDIDIFCHDDPADARRILDANGVLPAAGSP